MGMIFRQTVPMYMAKPFDWLKVNPTDKENPNFSILYQLNDCMRGSDGKFLFELRWPNLKGKNTQRWKQASNPVLPANHGSVSGYEAIEENFTEWYWGGLEFSGDQNRALMDGSVGKDNYWFYAIGST